MKMMIMSSCKPIDDFLDVAEVLKSVETHIDQPDISDDTVAFDPSLRLLDGVAKIDDGMEFCMYAHTSHRLM